MIRRLINKLQGTQWQAYCRKCGWTSGEARLTEAQALARARMHGMNAGCFRISVHIRKR